MRLAFLAVVILVAAACGAVAPSRTPPRPLGPGEQWLPVVDDHGGKLLCAGGGTVGDVRLHGAPDDPQVTWMTLPDGSRRTVVWPFGYSARFDPQLEVLDDHGTVIARENSPITGSCLMGNGSLVEFAQPERSTPAYRDPP